MKKFRQFHLTTPGFKGHNKKYFRFSNNKK